MARALSANGNGGAALGRGFGWRSCLRGRAGVDLGLGGLIDRSGSGGAGDGAMADGLRDSLSSVTINGAGGCVLEAPMGGGGGDNNAYSNNPACSKKVIAAAVATRQRTRALRCREPCSTNPRTERGFIAIGKGVSAAARRN